MYAVLAVSCHARLSAPNELSAMAAAAARTACATARVAGEVSVSFDRAGVASISASSRQPWHSVRALTVPWVSPVASARRSNSGTDDRPVWVSAGPIWPAARAVADGRLEFCPAAG